MMQAVVGITVALVGLVVGSFLNVCIYRLPKRQSVVWPGSRCATCDRPLAWYENVPLVSYAVLLGRCRTCGSRISIRYPIVEAITMGVFLLHWYVWGLQPILLPRLA
ncbi:MAG TPA: prepilin peptidase, partial [Vicinamibacterales bacterium]